MDQFTSLNGNAKENAHTPLLCTHYELKGLTQHVNINTNIHYAFYLMQHFNYNRSLNKMPYLNVPTLLSS